MPADNAPNRPNIILILADDMGYSDLGCFGGEISTPNLDRLAEEGMRFSQMYNTARCCPSRASLLTGLNPHQTGVGHMGNNIEGEPSYQGYLNNRCVTIAEVLRDAGYRTGISGKWHCGSDPERADEDIRSCNVASSRCFGSRVATVTSITLASSLTAQLSRLPGRIT